VASAGRRAPFDCEVTQISCTKPGLPSGRQG